MPRIRNTEKFLRIDKFGKKIPAWKLKILEKKEKKKWKAESILQKSIPQKSIPKSISKPISKPDSTVKILIEHYENMVIK